MRTYLVTTTIDFDFSQVIFGPYVFAKATSTIYKALLMLSSIHYLGKNHTIVRSISKQKFKGLYVLITILDVDY